MFFAVSSTSHLVLTQHLLLQRGSQMPAPSSPAMIAFDLVVHVGTMVVVVRLAVTEWFGTDGPLPS